MRFMICVDIVFDVGIVCGRFELQPAMKRIFFWSWEIFGMIRGCPWRQRRGIRLIERNCSLRLWECVLVFWAHLWHLLTVHSTSAALWGQLNVRRSVLYIWHYLGYPSSGEWCGNRGMGCRSGGGIRICVAPLKREGRMNSSLKLTLIFLLVWLTCACL